MTQIFRHALSNGLVLVAEPMDWLESVACTLLLPAGSVHDPEDRSGLAGFTCEMALRGAGERDSRRIIEDLDNLGVERGESVGDAFTSYSGAMLAGNFPAALGIVVDTVRRPHLPEEQLEASRLGLFQEIQAVEDEPADRVMIELKRRHYPFPWGRPSHGDEPSVEATTLDDIRGFFQRHYRPNGGVLAVAGKIDWDRLKDLAEELLGDWPRGPEPAVAERSRQGGYVHLPAETNQTHIGIAYPTIPFGHEKYYESAAAVGVLSGGMSSRLFTEVRERRGLCYAVHAGYSTLPHLAAVVCYAGTSAERAQETLDVTIAELQRLARGIEPAELERLKARIRSNLVMQQESSFGRSGSMAREWALTGRVQTLEEIEARVARLSCEGINAYLAERPPRDFAVVTLGPKPLEVPGGIR